MRFEDYPPQEPLSEVGRAFAKEVTRRAKGVDGAEHFYGDDPYQGINLHVPSNPNGSVLAFVHGGGWTSGYKEHLDFMAPAFTDANVVFASIGYRLAPQHLFPTGVNDVASGIAWFWIGVGSVMPSLASLRTNAAGRPISSNRFKSYPFRGARTSRSPSQAVIHTARSSWFHQPAAKGPHAPCTLTGVWPHA